MRKVVDSNYLNDPGLTTYLSESPQNFAVLCDYSGMEPMRAERSGWAVWNGHGSGQCRDKAISRV